MLLALLSDYFCQPRKWSVESGLTLYALFLQPQSCHVTKVWFQQRRRVHGTVTKEVLARRDRDCAQTFRAALTHQRKSLIEPHRRNSLSERRPHITGDKWWPHADRRFDAAFQLRQPKGSKVNLFFFPDHSSLPFCHVLDSLAATRSNRQMKAGDGKTIWEVVDWCWYPYLFFIQILSRTASHGLPNFQRNRLPMAGKRDGNEIND